MEKNRKKHVLLTEKQQVRIYKIWRLTQLSQWQSMDLSTCGY